MPVDDGPAALGFASRRRRYDHASTFAVKNGRALGGSPDAPLYSFEIDEPLSRASDLTALPAEFMPMFRAGDPAAKEMFMALYPRPSIVLPFHCQFHWLAVHITPNNIIFADSDAHCCHRAHIEEFAATLQSWTGAEFAITEQPVTRQPPQSAECGVRVFTHSSTSSQWAGSSWISRVVSPFTAPSALL